MCSRIENFFTRNEPVRVAPFLMHHSKGLPATMHSILRHTSETHEVLRLLDR